MAASVLVPLDGSPLADAAMPVATSIARRAGAMLLCVRASTGALGDEEARQLAASVDGARRSGVAAEPRVRTQEIPDHRAVAHAIAAAAEESGAGIIVMATRTRAGVEHWDRDSVASHVIRHARVPVLLVTAPVQQPWPHHRPPRILTLLDRTAKADGVIPHVAELAATLRAEVVLMRVVASHHYVLAGSSPFMVPDANAEMVETRLYLESHATALRLAGIPVRVHAQVGMRVPSVHTVAYQESADLVAMHEENKAARAVIDTVVTGCFDHWSVPLLVVPSAAARPAESGRS